MSHYHIMLVLIMFDGWNWLILLSRWSLSGLWWHLNHLPMEKSSFQSGAWLWAGAWLCSFCSGFLPSLCISWWERREAPGRCVCVLWYLAKALQSQLQIISIYLLIFTILISYFPQRLKSLCSPSEKWHPYLDVHRGDRYSEERCRRRKSDLNRPEVNVNVISSSWL